MKYRSASKVAMQIFFLKFTEKDIFSFCRYPCS